MTWVDDAINNYGQNLGFEKLTFDERGVINLSFETMGRLGIERQEEYILLYLTRVMSYPNADTYRTALQLCHYQENPFYVVQPALDADGGIMFSLRIPIHDFQLPELEQAIGYLDELHNRLAE